MKIQFIGCGNMWESILQSLLQNSFSSNDIYVNTHSSVGTNELKEKYWVHAWINLQANIIILAVKPQNLKDIDLWGFSDGVLCISILAGISTHNILSKLPSNQVIRCMPNLPIKAGKGVLGFYKTPEVSNIQTKIFIDMFQASSELIEVENEDKIDVITALSGSGPAYFYYLTELLKNKAILFWLNETQAQLLANATFQGSAHLLEQFDGTLETLRGNITSKWGTTQAAIETFESNQFDQKFYEWIDNAYQRAKDLNK